MLPTLSSTFEQVRRVMNPPIPHPTQPPPPHRLPYPQVLIHDGGSSSSSNYFPPFRQSYYQYPQHNPYYGLGQPYQYTPWTPVRAVLGRGKRKSQKVEPARASSQPGVKLEPAKPPNQSRAKAEPARTSSRPGTKEEPAKPSYKSPWKPRAKVVPARPPYKSTSKVEPAKPPNQSRAKVEPARTSWSKPAKVEPSRPSSQSGVKVEPAKPPYKSTGKVEPAGVPWSKLAAEVKPGRPSSQPGAKEEPARPSSRPGAKVEPAKPPYKSAAKVEPARASGTKVEPARAPWSKPAAKMEPARTSSQPGAKVEPARTSSRPGAKVEPAKPPYKSTGKVEPTRASWSKPTILGGKRLLGVDQKASAPVKKPRLISKENEIEAIKIIYGKPVVRSHWALKTALDPFMGVACEPTEEFKVTYSSEEEEVASVTDDKEDVLLLDGMRDELLRYSMEPPPSLNEMGNSKMGGGQFDYDDGEEDELWEALSGVMGDNGITWTTTTTPSSTATHPKPPGSFMVPLKNPAPTAKHQQVTTSTTQNSRVKHESGGRSSRNTKKEAKRDTGSLEPLAKATPRKSKIQKSVSSTNKPKSKSKKLVTPDKSQAVTSAQVESPGKPAGRHSEKEGEKESPLKDLNNLKNFLNTNAPVEIVDRQIELAWNVWNYKRKPRSSRKSAAARIMK